MEKKWWILIIVGIIILISIIIFFYPKKWDFSSRCLGFSSGVTINYKDSPAQARTYCIGMLYGKMIDKSLIDSDVEAIDFVKNDKEVINFIQSHDYVYNAVYSPAHIVYASNDFTHKNWTEMTNDEWSVTFTGKNRGDKMLTFKITPEGNITGRNNRSVLAGWGYRK